MMDLASRRGGWLYAALAMVTALFLIGCGGDATENPAETPKDAGSTPDTSDAPLAPAFDLPSIDGDSISLSDYRGKVVFVNFWATWCPPCREEMPLFNDLREQYGPKGFEILAISIDENPQEVVPEFVKRFGLKFPILLATQKTVQDYDVLALPSTFVVNREGRIVEVLTGGKPRDVFEPIIRKHL